MAIQTTLYMGKMVLSMNLYETMPSVTSTTFAEAKTGVFWDVEECPIPEDLDPESVYRNIKSSLSNKGYRGEVSIKAFGDRNQIPGYYESAGIEIFPQGDKFERIGKMQLEFFWWMRRNKSEFTNMMVISRDAMELESYFEYKDTHHNILFANPLNRPRKACGCKLGGDDVSTATWVWETLAAGGDPTIKTEEEEKEKLLCNNNKEGNDTKDSVSP